MRWGTLLLSALFLSSFSPAAAGAQTKTANPSRPAKEAAQQALPVNVLPTSNAFSDTPELDRNQYPKTVRLSAGSFAGRIAAYGAAHIILIGPKGWTGEAFIAVDGNTSVDLYPLGGSDTSGPRVHYSEVPACLVCMLGEAAPYFPEAMKRYNVQFGSNQSPIPLPKGLEVTRLSPTLVTYSLPNQNGLLVRGVAFYGSSQFIGVRYWLSPGEANLESFLEKIFILRFQKNFSAASH